VNGLALRSGGCQCGAVRYELAEPVLKIYVCHCHECRKQSASAFGISVFVPREALRVTRGTPRWWSRPTDSGRVLDCAFCPDCGARLWHQRAAHAEVVTVKAGSLDVPIDISDAVHIWTSRRMPGVVIPATARCYEGEPGN
jgi:hypothetical protein